MANWNLYRYRNPDGSSKDWAVITNPDASVTTRWGKTTHRLAGLSTRNGLRQADAERQKQSKGYCFVGEVTIDDDGHVALPRQNPNNPPSKNENHLVQAESPKSQDTLYWHIDYQVDPDTGANLAIELQRMTRVLKAGDDEIAQATQDWDGWQVLRDLVLNQPVFSHSGQIQPSHGVQPWLLLMALKCKDFVGLEIAMATEDSREISSDLKAEPAILAFFDTDLEHIRPVAEALGLLKPKLNLALAMAELDDSWF